MVLNDNNDNIVARVQQFNTTMPINISYMGTKRELAPIVAQVIRQTQPGILLDGFAGMCAVGEELADERQVWCNDSQLFAAEVAKALFTSVDEPPDAIWSADSHFSQFESHREHLSSFYREALNAEEALMSAETFKAFVNRRDCLTRNLASPNFGAPKRCHNLFTTTYADNYFGLRQAIDADSIVAAIVDLQGSGKTTTDQKRWYLLALGRALLKIANSTGHFAQYLKPNRSSYRRFCTQRKRDLWSEWLFSIGELCAVGTIEWRRKNKAFNENTLTLLPGFTTAERRPSVVYADPPYTDDQYSRYYHILDTLILYDYPTVSGAGLYRPDRFSTPFSLKSQVVQAFDSLIRLVAAIGADLVLSYPSNGLIQELGTTPLKMLKRHYDRVERCIAVPHSHSTFGASKGSAKAKVTEHIYMARS